MTSTYRPLTDDELLERIAQAEGVVTVVLATNSTTGQFAAGLCDEGTGAFLPISVHATQALARQAGTELEARLAHLARERPTHH